MYVPSESGEWIDENFARLSEILQDYDPHLKLMWIPPSERSDSDTSKPFAVVDTRTNYVVMYADETDKPQEILTRIFEGDNSKHNLQSRVQAWDIAEKAFKMKKELEEREEAMEFTSWMIGTKKNYIKHNGVKLDDQLRRIE